ncbi:hypothetical protein D3C87_1803010 [compost metagenome]
MLSAPLALTLVIVAASFFPLSRNRASAPLPKALQDRHPLAHEASGRCSTPSVGATDREHRPQTVPVHEAAAYRREIATEQKQL